MRYKPQHKEETHQKIVEAASKQFRAHGFEGVGIPKLMGALNLTHGGFYAHFADKEELVAEASVAALDQSLEAMLAGLKSHGFPAVLDYYLSEEQRDHPDAACMLPSLSAELARRPVSSRDAFTEKLSGGLPGHRGVHARTDARAQMVDKVDVLFAVNGRRQCPWPAPCPTRRMSRTHPAWRPSEHLLSASSTRLEPTMQELKPPTLFFYPT